MLTQLDVGIGKPQPGKNHPIGGQSRQLSVVGLFVGITAHHDQRQWIGQLAVCAQQQFRLVLRSESGNIKEVVVRPESPAFQLPGAHGRIAYGQPVGEVLGSRGMTVRIAVGNGGVVRDDAVSGLRGPTLAVFQPEPGESAPLFAAEVRPVHIDDHLGAAPSGEATEDGIAHPAEIDDVIVPAHRIEHRQGGVHNGVEALGRDGRQSDDVHTLPDRLGCPVVGQAVVDRHIMSPRGEAFAELLDDDLESRVAGRYAAGTEKGDAGFSGAGGFFLRLAAQSFADGVVDKERIELGVAPPETAGLLPKAVGPRGAGALHPLWCESPLSTKKDKGIAHREEDPAGVARQVVDDPSLLPLAAEGDPDEIGLGRRDGPGEGLFVVLGPRPEGRRQSTGNFEAGLDLTQVRHEDLECFFRSAEEKMAPRTRGGTDHFFHEIRAVDAVLEGGSVCVEAPAQRHAIGQDEVKLPHDFAEIALVAGQRDDVGIAGRHGGGMLFAGQPDAFRDGRIVIDHRHRSSEDCNLAWCRSHAPGQTNGADRRRQWRDGKPLAPCRARA